MIDLPPARHTWVVVWGKDDSAPEFHLFNLGSLDNLDDDDMLAVPWAHLLADAPFICIWRETETCWAGVETGLDSGLLPAPITLFAHPFASTLAGSGEAIAWLEHWRLEAGMTNNSTQA
ncbi:hypothetical protein BD309DRAFT_995579 [Dichomitus squalens]|uniref:Uncharacterized protein n=1 Tax=Dichomitus squalens TaxID=114155 RepID=A0A4Q9N702_9APHY|nr:hypothetical protein BD309DRAFT_995579 [Dichomitus squalens]TBU57707.1 hypothetical protein BD310DRAFT_949170 [Dichomitus squalens]